MGQALTIFREAGWLGWLVVASGVAGAIAGLAALVAAGRRSRAALWLGAAAVAAGALCSALGAYGVVHERTVTDRAVAMERPVQRERHRREGYRRARSAALLGLWLAALPLLAGAVAALAAPRRRPEDADLPPGMPVPRRLFVPVGVTLSGVCCAALAANALRAPLPGRDMPVDDPLWDVLDWVDALQAAKTPDDTRTACRRLGELLDADVGPRAKAAVPEYASIAAGCVRRGLDHAIAQAPAAAGIEELEVLSRSWFVRSEPELDNAVQQRALDLPVRAEPEVPEPEVTAGEPSITGKISREAIEAGFLFERHWFALCYKKSDVAYESAQGEVKLRFTIARSGKVTEVREEGASLGDEYFRRCVRSVIKTAYFRDAEGEVRVVLPVRFAPGVTR